MLKEYEKLLLKWNSKINLISSSTTEKIQEVHFQDGFELIPHLLKDETIIDFGSGNGIPGMVLSLSGFENVHLIESDLRKVIFLREVSRITKVPVSIHHMLIENYDGPKGDVITCRGFSSLKTILSLGEKILKKGGRYLCLKGRNFQEELEEINQEKFQYKIHHLKKGVIVEIW